MSDAYISDGVRFHLRVDFVREPETLGGFIDSRVAYLRKIRAMHEIFRVPLKIYGAVSAKLAEDLLDDLSNVRPWALKHAWSKTADPVVYSSTDNKDRPLPESTSRVGFLYSIGPLYDGKARWVKISERAMPANDYGAGSSDIVLPLTLPPEFLDWTFVKQLMLIGVEHFRPDTVRYSLQKHWYPAERQHFSDAEREAGIELYLGWLNYFANPAIRAVMPADVKVEDFGPYGGVLATLPTTPHDSDEANIAQLVSVYRQLLPGRWLTFEAMKPNYQPPA